MYIIVFIVDIVRLAAGKLLRIAFYLKPLFARRHGKHR
jgi:hypothetical protein